MSPVVLNPTEVNKKKKKGFKQAREKDMGKKKEEVEAEPAIGIGGVGSLHIKKRALKNKALAISFNDKDLKDFVGGFHKRKKKRRKEAQQQIKAKDRLKRIEKRKQRKQERAYVQGGEDVPADDSEPETGDLDQDDETLPKEAVAATKIYDAGNLTIMVTTSEISREEEDKQKPQIIPRPSEGTKKKPNIPVNKKQQKTASRRRSAPKLQKKREKRKGNVKKTR